MSELSPQGEREALLSALLDISINQFQMIASKLPADHEAFTDPDVSDLAGAYFGSMMNAMNPEDRNSSQLMFQAVAQMCDETLKKVVRIFGTLPEGVD